MIQGEKVLSLLVVHITILIQRHTIVTTEFEFTMLYDCKTETSHDSGGVAIS